MLSIFNNDYKKIRSTDCLCKKCLKKWPIADLSEIAEENWYSDNSYKNNHIYGDKFIIKRLDGEKINMVPNYEYDIKMVDVNRYFTKIDSYTWKYIDYPVYKKTPVQNGFKGQMHYLYLSVKVSKTCKYKK